MTEPTVEDMAAMRADGSLRDYFQFLIGRPPTTKPAPEAIAPAGPGYHAPSTGAWPCGSAPAGPTPMANPCPGCHTPHIDPPPVRPRRPTTNCRNGET